MERTDDGRYIVVNGRRWRATDPSIPDALRQELVDELMSARRAVRTDPATARPRVQDAKVALGERGEPWWDEATPDGRHQRLAATARALLGHRGPDGALSSEDLARVVGGTGWAALTGEARAVLGELAAASVVRLDPDEHHVVHGPEWEQRSERWSEHPSG
ncbi:DUF3253 domain-containing protein [uncultured Jatrophihabitans sp.]|uniref:DUF3253 domain-containing protein n=1 Tax=uncultured Jatrophihabitans sp. TaxID=1610747 RepID=UPI0035CA2521